jgi:hypothetical protein
VYVPTNIKTSGVGEGHEEGSRGSQKVRKVKTVRKVGKDGKNLISAKSAEGAPRHGVALQQENEKDISKLLGAYHAYHAYHA